MKTDTLVMVTTFAGLGIWAALVESWWVLVLSISTLAIYGLFGIWMKRSRIKFDQDGQPASGRDADRVALLELRAYEKNQRRIARRGDRSVEGTE